MVTGQDSGDLCGETDACKNFLGNRDDLYLDLEGG